MLQEEFYRYIVTYPLQIRHRSMHNRPMNISLASLLKVTLQEDGWDWRVVGGCMEVVGGRLCGW